MTVNSLHLVEHAGTVQPALAVSQSNVIWWKSAEGQQWRAYVEGHLDASDKATEIQLLTSLDGASHGVSGNYHYIVETDIGKASEEEFNAWYNTEHLPGLSRVPGTVRAQRYLRLSGSPRYIAFMESQEWLAIRHTAWSSRIRPMFMNTVRQLFIRHTSQAQP
jgi:hypothetical protein